MVWVVLGCLNFGILWVGFLLGLNCLVVGSGDLVVGVLAWLVWVS